MADQLGNTAQRFVKLNQSDAILWPVSEAAVSGLSVEEIDVGTRMLPQPAEPNINAILTLVTGSLFADIEAKAAFWQRPRRLPPGNRAYPAIEGIEREVILLHGRSVSLAFSNLQGIWSLVLAPNSLLGLKRLSVVEPSAFRMPENLWARIVLYFLVAYRLRTLNRGHLGRAHSALPCVGRRPSQCREIGNKFQVHVEAVASAFESDKQYIVSRWRWPDRFNS